MNKNFSEKDISKIAKGGGITLIGSLIGKVIFFLSQIIIARFLGIEQFGLYALGFTVVKICEIISKFGLHTGGMRFVSIYKDENPNKLKGVLISAILLSLLNGLIIGGVLFLFSKSISNSIFHKPELAPVLQLFSLSIVFVTALNVSSSLLRGFHTTKYTVYTTDIIQPVSNLILIIFFSLIGFKLNGVISAFTLSHFFAFIMAVFYLANLFPEFKNKLLSPIYNVKELLVYSFPLLFVGILHYFLIWTNVLLLGALSTTSNVGLYQAASQFPFIMALFLAAMTSIYGPVAANLYHKKEMDRFSNIFKTTTRWVSYLTLPIFLFLVFSAKELMTLFGKEYIQTGHVILVILSFGQLIDCISGSNSVTLTVTNRQKLELLNSLITVTIGVLLSYFLIGKYGALGAAISSSITLLLVNLIRLGEIQALYKTNPFSFPILKYLLPFGIAAVILLLFNSMNLNMNYIFLLVIKICLIFIVFIAYLIKGNILTAEDLLIYNKTKKLILKTWKRNVER
ncbi:MAG: flippase [Candidatus Ratteibacteria bacterium]|nr:flippase [Candidatus Ratteibacteria bacterium]